MKMKKIEAIIRKSQLDEVIEALHEIGIDFMTYWKVTGVGNELASSIYRSTVYETRLIERIHISFVCREIYVDSSCQAIINAARTGEMGDGKIFISPVEESIRIRTGETGPESLYIKE
jgi:nitrogen regulatory protein P-II 1